MYRSILSAHFLLNATKLLGQHFTVELDNDPKLAAKATQNFLKANKLAESIT